MCFRLGRPNRRDSTGAAGISLDFPAPRLVVRIGVLIPEGTLKGVDDATLKLADGSTTGLTLHTFDGTIPQLRRSLDRSLDAFFDLLPGADDEDLQKFAD